MLRLKGAADYIFENCTLSVSDGDVLYLPEGGDYNILIKEAAEYICIDFLFNKNMLSPAVIHNVKSATPQGFPCRVAYDFCVLGRLLCRKKRGYITRFVRSKRFSRAYGNSVYQAAAV